MPFFQKNTFHQAIIFILVFTLLLPMSIFPLSVHAQAVKVKPVVTNSMSWAVRDVASDTDTSFHFDISDRFGSLTNVSMKSSHQAATASINGNIAQINVLSTGKPVFTISGTDGSGNLVIDQFEAEITKLGDFTGDGIVTSADALFITRYLSGKQIVSDDEKLMMDINGDGQVTKEDAVALSSLYVGGSGSQSGTVIYTAIFRDVNDLPIARGVTVMGITEVGKQLTGSYQYFDVEKTAEGASILQWYNGSSADGSDKTKISGATSSTYTISPQDVGKYLFFGVTPVESGGQAGKEVVVSAGSQVTDVVASNPVVATLVPANGQTSVESDIAELQITFDKHVIAADKTITIRQLSDDAAVISYKANDATKVTIDKSKATLFVSGLQPGTSYYVEIESGAFTDGQGNPFAGITGSGTWAFTTEAKPVAPTITNLLPANQASDVDAKTASFQATFSEDVTAVSGNSVIVRKTADQSEVAKYDAADTANVTVNGKDVTIKAPALADGTGYYVEIEAGAFVNGSGTSFAGITGSGRWAFTTSASAVVNAVITASADPATLNENNLDAALITLTVDGDSFAGSAKEGDFSLNNAPQGLTIERAYVADGKAYLLLGYVWSRFQADINNFSVTAKGSALVKGVAATSNAMTIRAVPQTQTPFFSEYVDGGDGRIAIEIWNFASGKWGPGYEIEVQKYMKKTNTLQTEKMTILSDQYIDGAYIVISTTFYDYFDLVNIQYYNKESDLYFPNEFETTAILLKKDGKVIDVLGTPNATSPTPILSGGGTLVRRSGTIGGMDIFALSHWRKYPSGTYQYLGTHTP